MLKLKQNNYTILNMSVCVYKSSEYFKLDAEILNCILIYIFN